MCSERSRVETSRDSNNNATWIEKVSAGVSIFKSSINERGLGSDFGLSERRFLSLLFVCHVLMLTFSSHFSPSRNVFVQVAGHLTSGAPLIVTVGNPIAEVDKKITT